MSDVNSQYSDGRLPTLAVLAPRSAERTLLPFATAILTAAFEMTKLKMKCLGWRQNGGCPSTFLDKLPSVLVPESFK